MSADPVGARGVVFGTAGHVDHGKTTLVRALTGVDTDRWEEEKRRGLTIDLGFAPLELGAGGEGGIVDVPGHQDFLKNMLAGASGIDVLLLVVAADEGPMPQTREHLAIASLLGVRHGVVAVTKADRVESEWLELVVETVADEVQAIAGRRDWAIVPVSGTTGRGLETLREKLAEEAARVRTRPGSDLFRLPVDRAFTVHGTGTVVTGTLWSGCVRVGDRLRVVPAERRVRVRSLEVHGRPRESVSAGRRCAAALVGVEPSEVPRGSVLLKDGSWAPTRRIGARLRVLPHPPRPLEHGQRVRAHHGTRETMARVLLPEVGSIPPGGSGWGLLALEEPLLVRARDRLVLRFYSPVTTIGGADVAEPRVPRGWRARTARWDAVLEGAPEEALRAVLEAAGGKGVDRTHVAWRTGVESELVEALEAAPPEAAIVLGDRWFARDELRAARGFLLRRLSAAHRERPREPRVSREALRAAGGRRYAVVLVDRALSELAASGEIVADGPGVRSPDHEPVLSEREDRLKERLWERIAAGGAEPPTVDELAEELPLERDLLNDLLVLLEEEGRIVAVTPELYLTRETLRELEGRARRILEREGVASPASFKESFGVTRKYLIPVLEYLDRTGVTRRTGEGRELAR